jgi:photoactive yellow protein
MEVVDEVSSASMSVGAISLDELDRMAPSQLDELRFGVIGLDAAGAAVIYNATESRLAGLRPERVLGQNFFLSIGLCMNNFLVAQRFEDEPILDDTIDYVLTLRMRPTKVRLRLLRRPDIARRYILIERS